MLELGPIGGHCPVQSFGRYYGRQYYFRARGDRMQMHIAVNNNADALDDEAWYYEEEFGAGPFGAGWAKDHECLAFMARAFAKWDADHPIEVAP